MILGWGKKMERGNKEGKWGRGKGIKCGRGGNFKDVKVCETVRVVKGI